MPVDRLKRLEKRILALENRLTPAPLFIRSGVPRPSDHSIAPNSGSPQIIIVSNERRAPRQLRKKETSS